MLFKALLFAALLSAFPGDLFDGNADIGATAKAGSAAYDPSTGTYRITGGGANIWAKMDAFQFVYKQVSGDFTLSADVHFVGKGVEAHRKLALMVRQSLTSDSAYADVAVHGDGLTSLQYRPTVGVDTSEFRAAMKDATHISITRHGNEFTISASDVGVQPATTGPIIVSMQDPVYVGLAVCAHNADALETATFSNVKLNAAGSR
jgi:TolB protein